MKKLIQILVVAFLPFIAQAQLGNFEEVVYLKSGNVYRGVIIEQIPGVSLKIQSSDRNVFAVKIEDVEKITREEMKPTFTPHQFYIPEHHFMYDHKMPYDSTNHKYKPGGVYLTLGPDAVAYRHFAGVGFELGLGRKIFNKRSFTRGRTIGGGDVFAFAGAMVDKNRNMSYQFGINIGPSIAVALKHKRFVYITPYIGLTAIGTRSRHDEYDINGNLVQKTRTNYAVAAPVGLKFEVAINKFFIGTNASVGASYGDFNNSSFNSKKISGYARAGINFGVKF